MRDSTDSESTASATDTRSNESNHDDSVFGELLDWMEEHRTSREADQSDTADSRSAADDADPFDRARAVLADRLPGAHSDNGPASDGTETKQRGVRVGLVLGIGLTLVLVGISLVTVGHVLDTVVAPSPATYVDANDTLYLEDETASYLTRIYGETTHEIAFCGFITHDGGRPTLDVWMANTINAGPDQIEFITENCPDPMHEVLLHTHPGGSRDLSAQDRRTFAERSATFMCVQAGPLEADAGTGLEDLVCYRASATGDLARIPVVLLN